MSRSRETVRHATLAGVTASKSIPHESSNHDNPPFRGGHSALPRHKPRYPVINNHTHTHTHTLYIISRGVTITISIDVWAWSRYLAKCGLANMDSCTIWETISRGVHKSCKPLFPARITLVYKPHQLNLLESTRSRQCENHSFLYIYILRAPIHRFG